jgi:type IV secretory pathway VirJ component
MYTTYHLTSAEHISSDIIEAIKASFKSKPIVITVEEELDATAYLMSTKANKAMIEKSIKQDKKNKHIVIKHKDL